MPLMRPHPQGHQRAALRQTSQVCTTSGHPAMPSATKRKQYGQQRIGYHQAGKHTGNRTGCAAVLQRQQELPRPLHRLRPYHPQRRAYARHERRTRPASRVIYRQGPAHGQGHERTPLARHQAVRRGAVGVHHDGKRDRPHQAGHRCLRPPTVPQPVCGQETRRGGTTPPRSRGPP